MLRCTCLFSLCMSRQKSIIFRWSSATTSIWDGNPKTTTIKALSMHNCKKMHLCAKTRMDKKVWFWNFLDMFSSLFFFFFIVVFFKFYFREKEFPRRLSTSRGGVLGDGVQTEIISYSYACTPVELGTDRGKEYMVCVALAKGDTGEKYASRLISE